MLFDVNFKFIHVSNFDIVWFLIFKNEKKWSF